MMNSSSGKTPKRHILVSFLLATGVICVLPSTAAYALTLADLIAGGSFQVGNVVFENWSYSSSGLASDPALVGVVSQDRFHSPEHELLPGVWFDPEFSLGDHTIAFDARTVDSSSMISDFIYIYMGIGRGQVYDVSQTITDVSGNVLFNGSEHYGPGGELVTPSDMGEFTPQSIVHYSLHVTGQAVESPISGGADAFDLAFSLTPVPEPTSLLLLGTGLGALGLVAWRRKK